MTVHVGIFEQEDRVLDGIRSLREAGAEPEKIRVVVANREGAPLLASSQDVNLEEAYEVQAALSRESGDEWVPGVAPISAYPMGNIISGNGTTPGAFIAANAIGDGVGTEEALAAIGIPDRCRDRCADAIDNGRYLLLFDSEADIGADRILERAGAIGLD